MAIYWDIKTGWFNIHKLMKLVFTRLSRWQVVNTIFFKSYVSYHQLKKNCAAEKSFRSFSQAKAFGNVAENLFGRTRRQKTIWKFIFSGVSFTPMSFWILLEKWKNCCLKKKSNAENTTVWIRIHINENSKEDIEL